MRGAWPLVGHAGALLRDPLGFLERAYPLGDVVALRLGPKPALLVNDAERILQILVADAGSYDKGFQFDQLRTLIGDGIGTSGGAKHRRQRRLMYPAFDHRHVEGYVAAMNRSATRAVAQWRDGGRIDAAHEMRLLSMNATVRAMFEGSNLNAGADPNTGANANAADADSAALRGIMASLPVLLGGIGRRALLPLDFLNRVPTAGNRRFDEACAALHALVDRMVAEHRARQHGASVPTPGETPSLLSTLLSAVDEEDGSGMTDEQAHDEIMTVLLAGTETTAGTLAWTLHVLSREPDLQREVRLEVDAALGGRLPTAADLRRLPLTRRVVSEVLRCYPPGWILGRRPIEDVQLGDTPVAAGTQVLLNFYGLHRDPAVYPDPGRFDPGRWRDPDPALLRGRYLPFGLGSRGCIGEAFAWSLMLSTIAVTVSQYSFTAQPGVVVRPVARTTLHPDTVPLLLEAR
ncbi:MAG TPA: cytochrome P450 [Actinocrinis sp.]|nr:cytochrome P450 [Actinocrinis sp.]